MLRLSRFFLLALVPAVCFADNLVYLRIDRPVIEQRLQMAPQDGPATVRTLRTLFEKAGCPASGILQQTVRGESSPNVICTLPGTGEGMIVVGTALDYDEHSGQPAVHWGGVAMLPLLAESLNSSHHQYTLVFAGFAGKHGQRGASWYLDHLAAEQRETIRAMVGLNDLGRSPTVYLLGQEDRKLASLLEIAATTLRLPYTPTRLEITLPAQEDDYYTRWQQIHATPSVNTKAFQRAHIPAIMLHSMAPRDDKSAATLDIAQYEDAYRLLCVYVLYLDRNPGQGAPGTPSLLMASSAGGSGQLSIPSAAPGGQPTQPSNAVSSGTGVPAAGTLTATATPPSSVPGGTTTTLTPTDLPTPVFRAKARLVQVDVSVRDKQGRPLQGLKAEDFTVLEDGKPQAVRAFEPHTPKTAAEIAAAPPPPLQPPNTFTNRNSTPPDDTVSILLLDLLNTPAKDQMYARAQMIKFLKAMPPGKRLALFVLSTHVEVLKGFTESSEAMVKAAEKLMATQSMLLTTEADREQNEGDNDFVGAVAKPNIKPGPGSGLAAAAVAANNIDLGHANVRTRTEATFNALQTRDRVGLTLTTLTGIARAVAVYPGRKNLVWLSGSFPVRLKPVAPSVGELSRGSGRESTLDNLNATDNFQPQIRAATAMLAAARIAVYPLDVRGLQTGGIDISNSAGDTLVGIRDNAQGYGRVLNDQSRDRYENRAAMQEVAEQTGGELFGDSNDIRGAIGRSIDDGSNYYTLAYTPQTDDTKNEFRHIEVKLNRDDAKLSYRRGYYPKPSDGPVESAVRALAMAMQPGAPASTMLLLTAKVLPPDDTHTMVRIDYQIDLSGMEFADSPDLRRQTLVDCMAVAFTKDNSDAGHVANTLGLTFTEADFQASLRSGIPAHQELTLPPGKYQLRIGVLDRMSQRIGTLDVPLEVTASTAKN